MADLTSRAQEQWCADRRRTGSPAELLRLNPQTLSAAKRFHHSKALQT